MIPYLHMKFHITFSLLVQRGSTLPTSPNATASSKTIFTPVYSGGLHSQGRNPSRPLIRARNPPLNAKEWFRDACARAKKDTARQIGQKQNQRSVNLSTTRPRKSLTTEIRNLGKNTPHHNVFEFSTCQHGPLRKKLDQNPPGL